VLGVRGGGEGRRARDALGRGGGRNGRGGGGGGGREGGRVSAEEHGEAEIGEFDDEAITCGVAFDGGFVLFVKAEENVI
jgi:hypothetical protein